jgi:hypothetical protein
MEWAFDLDSSFCLRVEGQLVHMPEVFDIFSKCGNGFHYGFPHDTLNSASLYLQVSCHQSKATGLAGPLALVLCVGYA